MNEIECCARCAYRYNLKRSDYSRDGKMHEQMNGFICGVFADEGRMEWMINTSEQGQCEGFLPKKYKPELILLSDELASQPEGTVIWAEYRTPIKWTNDEIPLEFEPSVLFPMVMHRGAYGNYRREFYPSEYDACDSIRMHCRFWDAKPTKKQMKDTPWPTWEECQKYWK